MTSKSWIQSLKVGSWVQLPNGYVARISHVSDRKLHVGDWKFSRRTAEGLREPPEELILPLLRQEAIIEIRAAVLEEFPTHVLQALATIVRHLEKPTLTPRVNGCNLEVR
jgi:hypothetical protein